MNDVFLSHKELKDIFQNVTVILKIFFDTIIKSYFTTTIHDFFFLHSQDVILELVILPVNPGADKLFLIARTDPDKTEADTISEYGGLLRIQTAAWQRIETGYYGLYVLCTAGQCTFYEQTGAYDRYDRGT